MWLRILSAFFSLILLASLLGNVHAQSRNLDIYWIDVEGGAATLIVSPSGESMLIDTGHRGEGDRDAKRIFAATQVAGLKKIDYIVTTYLGDGHVGGLAALAKLIPINKFIDDDDQPEKADQKWLDIYTAVSAGKRIGVKAGDEIPLKGVQVLVVATGTGVLEKPVHAEGPNQLCAGAAKQKPMVASEHQGALGLLVAFGKFKFLDLSDDDLEEALQLSCPVNKLGAVTLYQASGDGSLEDARASAFLGAINPQVVVVNNGPKSAYGNTAYEKLAKVAGKDGVWQVHQTWLNANVSGNINDNTAQEMIANVDDTGEDRGNWVKASIGRDGKCTLTNGRNGYSFTYVAR